MPPSAFSWDRFPEGLIRAVALSKGLDPATPVQSLVTRLSKPSPALLKDKTVRQAVLSHWLPTHSGVYSIALDLYNRGFRPSGAQLRSREDCLDFIVRCRNTPALRKRLATSLNRFGEDRPELDPPDPNFSVVCPAKQQPDPRQPYDHQREAWDRLDTAWATANGSLRGILVMPTGSGKTYTAARWITEKILNRGRTVLWIAHRQELIDQAASAFLALAAHAPSRDCLRIRKVSGAHSPLTTAGKDDHVLICSVQSLASRPDLARLRVQDPDRILVIDEAHHAVARSYRQLVDELDDGGVVLGLTATPTRTAEAERPVLSRLFGDNILFELPAATLKAKKILAHPIVVQVKTHMHAEADATIQDIDFLGRFNDLGPAWLKRIASYEQRNKLIVDHLKDEELRRKYGKTLIFAINIAHAELLTEELQKEGIRAACVTSDPRIRREDADDGNAIEEFRRPDSGLDVLVNVQMLTEGVDIPNIQTVFLTRPTTSEILLRQMIGRALRGPLSGGTETAYLVSFEDHWSRFRDFESPLALVSDIVGVEQAVKPTLPAAEDAPAPAELLAVIPWELIRSAADAIRRNLPHSPLEVLEAIPCGWYILEREVDGQTVSQIIPVYEHQHPSWQALIAALHKNSDAARRRLTAAVLFDEYFYDCAVPQPAEFAVSQLLAHFQDGGGDPPFVVFEDRQTCDPAVLARQCWDGGWSVREIPTRLREAHGRPLLHAIYPNYDDFSRAFHLELENLQLGRPSSRIPKPVPIFEPLPENSVPPGGNHDLLRLRDSMLLQAASILKTETPPFSAKLEWTRRPLKGWFGMAYFGAEYPQEPGAGRIRINCLLNSPAIQESTLEFLLWHEYLHIYRREGHTTAFRELERSWPNHADADRELDRLREMYDLHYC